MTDIRKTISLLIFVLVSLSIDAQVKILFDATKAETAANADWQIDADLFNLGYTGGPPVAGTGNEAITAALSYPCTNYSYTINCRKLLER